MQPITSLHARIDGAALTQRVRGSSYGVQAEGAYDVAADHVLRVGLFATTERLARNSRVTTSSTDVASSARASRGALSIFVQDEWPVAPTLTANFGARGDRIGGTDASMYIQPRASLVWRPSGKITFHAGYARSITAASLEDSLGRSNSTRPVERSDVLEGGPQWHSGTFTVGLDGYLRQVRNLFATRYRADAPVGDVFSYERARIAGGRSGGDLLRRAGFCLDQSRFCPRDGSRR